jgi:hypothetical protein
MKRSRSASTSPAPSWSSLSSTDPARTPSNLESSPSVHRSHKHVRSAQDASTSAETLIRCTIGPICSSSPQTFSTQKALQSHYVKAHSFVCKGLVSRDRKQWGLQGANAEDTLGDEQGSGEMEECGKIFPEDRLLELVSGRFPCINPLSFNAIVCPKLIVISDVAYTSLKLFSSPVLDDEPTSIRPAAYHRESRPHSPRETVAWGEDCMFFYVL